MPTNSTTSERASDRATVSAIAATRITNEPTTVCEMPRHVATETGAVARARRSTNAGATTRRSSDTLLGGVGEVMTVTLGLRDDRQTA